MNVYKINTTAFEEEDFYLLTTLTSAQVEKAIRPIVQAERDSADNQYDNDMLVEALKRAYPKATVEMYQEFDVISI